MKINFLLCSKCFRDEGLYLDAEKIGVENDEICQNCNSKNGKKLTKKLVRNLCYRFFVRGTVEKLDYGGFPIIQMNEYQINNKNGVELSEHLKEDAKIIENAGEIGLFYYPPRFWMLGEIEPLKDLQNQNRNKIIEKVFELYPTKEFSKEDSFYRLRLNPENPENVNEYDSPPDNFIGDGRLDDLSFPLLYGSQDLQICIHECRTSAEDNIYVGKLKPTRNLKLLDLTELIKEEEGVSEFESLDLAIHFLFLAGKHSYLICREIAKSAFKKNYDGIIYPSYFSYISNGLVPFETIYGISIRKLDEMKDYAKSQVIPNLAIFGRPINEGILKVECINKVIINQVFYETSFGPAAHNGFGPIPEEK